MKKNAERKRKHRVLKKAEKADAAEVAKVFKNSHLVSFARFLVSIGFSWFRLVSFGFSSFQVVSVSSGGLSWFQLV